MSVSYLKGNSIARRILEFPPVETDEDLENFQKLIGKMWIELEPYFRGRIGTKLDESLLNDFEAMFPFAYFYAYDNTHLAIKFKRDYLDERNMSMDAYGHVCRKV